MISQLALAVVGNAWNMYQSSETQKSAHSKAMEVPRSRVADEAYQATEVAENIAKGRMGGAEEAERSLKEASATAARRSERAATSASQVQAGVSGAQAMENRGIRKINEAEASDKTSRQGMYMNQLYRLAGLKQATEDSNKSNAYNVEAAIMEQAAQQQGQAFNNLLGSTMMGVGSLEQEKANRNAGATDDNKDVGVVVDNTITPAQQTTIDTIGGKGIPTGNTTAVGGTSMSDYLKSGTQLPYTEWVRQQKTSIG